MTNWIKVEDRLPDIEKPVLIYVHSQKEIHTAQFCNWEKDICDDWHLTGGAYTYDPLVFKREEVSHWMPLPEPPEKE
jgi:hypothetical protein